MTTNRLTRCINNQYQRYQELKSSIVDEYQWILEYGYYIIKDQDKFNQWYALVIGPEATLYSGVLLAIRIIFPDDYPFSPPRMENLLSFPKQFNTNLWSADTIQSLISINGEYKPYYGLICMDILNTPHSKIETNRFGEMIEVYDKSKDSYTPVQGIHSILMAMRSNLLTGETKLPHISDQSLQYLTIKYLTTSVYQGKYSDKFKQSTEYLNSQIQSILIKIKSIYQKHYLSVLTNLLDSDLAEKKEIADMIDYYMN